MKKILYVVAIVVLASYFIYAKEDSLIKTQDHVEQIRIFDLNTDHIWPIEDMDEIKEILQYLGGIKVKKARPYLKSKELEFLISTYGQNGEALETFYISKDKLVQYHWLVTSEKSGNLYEFILKKVAM